MAVAGIQVTTGDLLVADLHGVLRIPPEIPIAELVAVGHENDRLESEIFACTRAVDFSIENLERCNSPSSRVGLVGHTPAPAERRPSQRSNRARARPADTPRTRIARR